MLKAGVTLLLLLNFQHAWATNLKLVAAARSQVGVTKSYDPQYTKLAYPNGDVEKSKGVCTDVIIRALRDAHQLDLQQLVHEDMAQKLCAVPQKMGPEKNG